MDSSLSCVVKGLPISETIFFSFNVSDDSPLYNASWSESSCNANFNVLSYINGDLTLTYSPANCTYIQQVVVTKYDGSTFINRTPGVIVVSILNGEIITMTTTRIFNLTSSFSRELNSEPPNGAGDWSCSPTYNGSLYGVMTCDVICINPVILYTWYVLDYQLVLKNSVCQTSMCPNTTVQVSGSPFELCDSMSQRSFVFPFEPYTMVNFNLLAVHSLGGKGLLWSSTLLTAQSVPTYPPSVVWTMTPSNKASIYVFFNESRNQTYGVINEVQITVLYLETNVTSHHVKLTSPLSSSLQVFRTDWSFQPHFNCTIVVVALGCNSAGCGQPGNISVRTITQEEFCKMNLIANVTNASYSAFLSWTCDLKVCFTNVVSNRVCVQYWNRTHFISTVENLSPEKCSYALTKTGYYYRYNISVSVMSITNRELVSNNISFSFGTIAPTGKPVMPLPVKRAPTYVEISLSCPGDFYIELFMVNVFLYNKLVQKANLSTDVASNFTLSNLMPARPYIMAVNVINEAGISPFEFFTFSTAPPVPKQAPANLMFSNLTQNTAYLTWNQIPEDKVVVDSILSFDIIYGSSVTWDIANNSLGVTYTDSRNQSVMYYLAANLTAYTMYRFGVRACSFFGCGPYAYTEFTTSESGITVIPRALSCMYATSSSITISWIPAAEKDLHGKPTGHIVDYVPRDQYDGVTFLSTFIPGGGTTSTSFGDLIPQYLYIFRIRSTTEFNIGPPSDPIQCLTRSIIPDFSPKIIGVASESSGCISVFWEYLPYTWGMVQLTNVHVIFSKTSDNGSVISTTAAPTDMVVTCCSLVQGENYNVSMAAATSEGVGPFSPQQRVRVLLTVDGDWSNWSDFGECSSSCENGTKTRWRECTNPSPLNNGLSCIGDPFESAPCYNPDCPVPLPRSEWLEWSPCSVSCGPGAVTVRRLNCSLPMCSTLVVKGCNVGPCPVDGSWGEWSLWSVCEMTPKIGNRKRTRACNNPVPSYGGSYCTGIDEDVWICDSYLFQVNGGWGAWGEWTRCLVACGQGIQRRVRSCNSPSPDKVGSTCKGQSVWKKTCYRAPCKEEFAQVSLRLTDEEWIGYHYMNRYSQPYLELQQRLNNSAFHALNYRSTFKGISIISLSRGSVLAKVMFYFSQVPSTELIQLRDIVDSNRALGSMPVQTITPWLYGENVLVTLDSVTSLNCTFMKLMFSWTSASSMPILYFIAARKLLSIPNNNYDLFDIPLVDSKTTSMEYNIGEHLGLKSYSISVSAVINGKLTGTSNIVNYVSDEGVPSIAPNIEEIYAIRGTSVYLAWSLLTLFEANGQLTSHKITLVSSSDMSELVNVIGGSYNTTLITSLSCMTLYHVFIKSCTIAGCGPSIHTTVTTLEGVPAQAPPDVEAPRKYDVSSLLVRWGPIPRSSWKGELLGYSIRYRQTSLMQPHPWNYLSTDTFTLTVVINGLDFGTTYEIQVAGFNIVGPGPYSDIVLSATCNCLPTIYVRWYEQLPFIYLLRPEGDAPAVIDGVVYNLITQTLALNCGPCRIYDQLNVKFSTDRNGSSNLQENESQVLAKCDSSVDLCMMVSGPQTVEHSPNGDYIPFVKSKKFVLISRKVDENYFAKLIQESIFFSLPVLIIVVTIITLFGVLLWLMERSWMDPYFPTDNPCNAIFNGIWWSFVTFTTVGYGDVELKYLRGRLIAIVWILAAQVCLSLLIGSITTYLTSTEISRQQSKNIYGLEVGVVSKSLEYTFAIMKMAKPVQNGVLDSPAALINNLRNGTLSHYIIDLSTFLQYKRQIYEASFFPEIVADSNFSSGIILKDNLRAITGGVVNMASSNMQKVIVEQNKLIAESVLPSTPQSGVGFLMDPRSYIFMLLIISLSTTVLVLCLAGMIWTYTTGRRKNKPKLKNSVLPTNHRNTVMKCMELLKQTLTGVEKTSAMLDLDQYVQRERCRHLQEAAVMKKLEMQS